MPSSGVPKRKKRVLTSAEQKIVDRQAEMRRMQEFVDGLIARGEAKAFLVKHGFITPSGKPTKRYGG